VFAYGRCGLARATTTCSARRLATDGTRAAFTLVDLGAYPAAVAGGTTAIVGEVFEVDAATLARLDRLEGHPRLYQRTTVRLASRRVVEMYVMTAVQAAGWPVIASGDWLGRR
jgi:gamma-glutamylcyclotransferase (GGCT)/AIG2-like uncharacterized protein YtfP